MTALPSTPEPVPALDAALEHGRTRGRLPKKVIVGAIIVGAVAMAAAVASLIGRYDPIQQDILHRLQPPSAAHWFGTDALGRDVYARTVFAARIDLPMAFLAALFPMIVGTFLGSLAGFFGRWADALVMRSADLVQAFPVYVFLIALVFALGPGFRSILIAFTAIGWVVYARLIRGEILRVRSLDYVQAARVAGLPRRRVLARHVMPNTIQQTIVYFMSDMVLAMITFASLSFLGLGISPPTPEWGAMISDGQPYLRSEPWLTLIPGAMIVLVGIGFSLVGDGLDDYLRS